MAGHRIGGGDGGGDDDANEQHQPLMGPSSPPPRSSSRSAMMSSDVEMANGRRRPLKATEKMWVVATVTLISFLSFSSQFCVLIPYWLSTPSVTWSQMLLYLVPFNCGVAGIFYNYYCVVYTSPGDVPPGWEPDWDALGGVEVKASTGSPRYCKVCRSYKPPRAHHCRVCKRCVLRMDHHCPWVANCVGHGNYGHFLRFLWTVDVTMAMHVALLSLRVADWWNPNMFWREPTTAAMVLMVLNFAQGVPVFIMVGAFSIYHTYALCTNTTTIEGWEKDKVAMLVRRGKIEEVKYPYDLGMKRNIQSILGKRALFWCMPGQGPLGNGLDYNLAEGHGGSRRVLRVRDIDESSAIGTGWQRGEGPPSAQSRLASTLRNGHPGVDAVFRSVAAGAGRATPPEGFGFDDSGRGDRLA